MPGIEHDPLSDIQNIRRLLDDYAPGFAFLKELLQNADDAAASNLQLSWSPGLIETRHPLLKGPALVSINDGNFTPSDKSSLQRMGLGNKGGNAAKIGKFGLGTKSIFHVAEAFFFLESAGNKNLRDILNPWSPRFHSDWDLVESPDWQHLHAECSQLAEGLEPWFAIWIPLRRQDVLKGLEPIRNGVNAFPGSHTTCPADLLKPIKHADPSLGELFPLLRHLKKVGFKDGHNLDHVIEIDHRTRTIQHGQDTLSYSLSEQNEPTKAEQWKQLPSWPRVFEIKEDASEEARPDKAEWSHSVVLTTTLPRKGDARLRIYWSVFLPVGNQTYCDISMPGGARDISLFLHGFFFLNDSRTQIRGLAQGFPNGDKDDPTGVCTQWNHELACSPEGLLPSLLPALGGWLMDGSIHAAEAPLLVKAIVTSPLWSSFRNVLTSNGALAYCTANTPWSWRWIPRKKRTVVVPRIHSLEDLAIFENLTKTNDSKVEFDIVFAVSFTERPALASSLDEFDESCLLQLRKMLGGTVENLSENEADLLAGILGTTTASTIPTEWDDVPLFPTKPTGRGEWKRMTLPELRTLNDAGNLFSNNEHDLATHLAKAAGETNIPVILGTKSISYLAAPNLTYENAADWLLRQTALSSKISDRLPVIKKFASLERFGVSELSAIRYLAHGKFPMRNVSEPTLYSPPESKDDLWGEAYRVVLLSLKEDWRLIDRSVTLPLSANLKQRTSINECSRDTWPQFIRGLDICVAHTIDFSLCTDTLLEWILKETPDNQLECIRPLRIHRLASGEMVSASDEAVWLEGELQVPENLAESWLNLRKSARVLMRSNNDQVYRRQKAVFGERVLDASGSLKLAAGSTKPGDYWQLILHMLSSGTPRIEAIEALKTAKWLPIHQVDGTQLSVAPEAILHLVCRTLNSYS
jgi:hypothetical protein